MKHRKGGRRTRSKWNIYPLVQIHKRETYFYPEHSTHKVLGYNVRIVDYDGTERTETI